MFLAYAQVQHAQYPFYQAYALLTPGPATLDLATDILSNAQGDDIVTEFHKDLRLVRAYEFPHLAETHLFAIRSSNGTTFDIYLTAEDSIFHSIATEVPQSEVLNTGRNLLAAM